MPRSFDGLTESTASVEQIFAALGREDYWRARVVGDDGSTTLDSLLIDPDGTVEVRVTQHLGRQLLPKPVTKFMPGDLKLAYTETWTPNGDGDVHGQVAVAVSGGLGSCHAKTWLESNATGSRLRFTGRVEVKIPLVGGNLEKVIGTGLAGSISDTLRFTTTWIAEQE
jgi:hypothetical protein